MEFYFEEFRVIRKSQKMSIQKIVDRLNKSYKTVWSWEKGEHKPKPSDIRLLANILGVDVSEISNLHESRDSNMTLNDLAVIDKDFSEESYSQYLKDEIIRLNRQLKHQYRVSGNLNKLLDSIQSLFYTKRIDLRFSYVNTALASVLGYTKNEIIGKQNHELLSYNDTLTLNKLEQEVVDSGISIRNREIFIPGTGRLKYGLISIYPEYENNKIISLNCCIRDITERIFAKNKLNMLEENRKILETAVNKVDECVWIGEKQSDSYYKYKHLFISNAFEKLLGLSKERFIEKKMSLYDFIHPDFIKIVQKIHSTEKYPKYYEYKIIRVSDQKVRWIQENVYLDNNIVFGIMRDVTEMKDRMLNIER